jgi:DNA-binding beta-propeller fold protein YncE
MTTSKLMTSFAVLGLAACTPPFGPGAGSDYEVWVVDQSNSPGLTHGGAIHIYQGEDLREPGAALPVPQVIDLGGATTALCQSSTGAAPVRPHMIFFNSSRSHAVLSFVASGHVAVFDAVARTPVACLRTTAGAGGARQAHAAIPAPDDSYILVANQNGKLLERITSNFATNTYGFDPAATLNLATCTTPGGAPCESALLRPDNAPICPVVDRGSRVAFVTLRGGGLVVVDPKATPMRILAEYDSTVVRGNGCGGLQVGGSMFLNSGGGTTANLTEFDVYRFEVAAFGSAQAPNTPAPVLVYRGAEGHRDAHGMAVTGNGRYVWVADRAANLLEVFDARSNQRRTPIDLPGPLSADPTPDLLDMSPGGDLVFFTLRGPTPLSGDPHVSTGTTPGIAIMAIRDGGARGELRQIVPITNRDASGVERADPHGIRVRVK